MTLNFIRLEEDAPPPRARSRIHARRSSLAKWLAECEAAAAADRAAKREGR